MEDIVIGVNCHSAKYHPVYGPWTMTVLGKGRLKVFCGYFQHGSDQYREDLFFPQELEAIQ